MKEEDILKENRLKKFLQEYPDFIFTTDEDFEKRRCIQERKMKRIERVKGMIEMRFIQGKTYKKIGRKYKITEGSARGTILRNKDKILLNI